MFRISVVKAVGFVTKIQRVEMQYKRKELAGKGVSVPASSLF